MKQRSILIVDDEPHIRRLIELTLRKGGFETLIFAQNGREALSMAQKLHVDLIIMDFVMPGLDGLLTLELLRRREDTAKVPVIMVSGNVELHALHDLPALGADAVLGKPCSPSLLLATVERVLHDKEPPALAA